MTFAVGTEAYKGSVCQSSLDKLSRLAGDRKKSWISCVLLTESVLIKEEEIGEDLHTPIISELFCLHFLKMHSPIPL